MKIAWSRMKGVCLLLLGLATTGGGQSFTAEINTQNLAPLAESSSLTIAGTAAANPFKDESVSAPGMADANDAGVAECCSPSREAEVACEDPFAGAPGRFWFRGEYLNWWTSGAHLPPMVSTFTGPNGNIPSTLFGDREIRDGSHAGYRINFGMWLDAEHRWGVEGDYFDLTGRPDDYDSGYTDGYANGNPFPIVRLLYDPSLPGVVTNAVGYPGFYVGRITVDSSDYFQSAGLWLRRQLWAREWSTGDGDVNWTDRSARTFRLDAIGGYRFARLIDTVDEHDDSTDINSADATYLNTYDFVNSYRTVNTFNGGELGWNAVYTHGRWSLDVVGKTAIGVNNQYVRLYNQETIDMSNATGIGTPPSPQNTSPLQEFSRNRFSVIPQFTVTAGYQLTDHLKVTAGYDLLYWSAVVRAADQIAVEPTTGYPYGTISGNYAALPAFTWNESHFFAQGLRLGAELRF